MTLGFIIGDVVNVKPSKIVAGLEVERTNEWLQTMAKAVVEKKSSAEAVKRVLSGEKPTKRNSTSNSSTNNTKKKALSENTKTSNNRVVKTKREVNETKETKGTKETKETKDTKSEQKKQIMKDSKESKQSRDAIDSKQSPLNEQTPEPDQSQSPLMPANGANQRPSQLEPELSGVGSDPSGSAAKPGSASEDSPKIDERNDDTNDQSDNKERQNRYERQDSGNGSANNEQVLQQRPALDHAITARPKTGAKPTAPQEVIQNSGKLLY